MQLGARFDKYRLPVVKQNQQVLALELRKKVVTHADPSLRLVVCPIALLQAFWDLNISGMYYLARETDLVSIDRYNHE